MSIDKLTTCSWYFPLSWCENWMFIDDITRSSEFFHSIVDEKWMLIYDPSGSPNTGEGEESESVL
jgi:hypothetical protein